MKMSLHVGLNFYGSPDALRGSVNTAKLCAKLFKAKGYVPAVCTEEYANRTNISEVLKDMYKRASRIAITWSGHAMKIMFQGNLYRCLVPWDVLMEDVGKPRDVPDWNRVIPDTWPTGGWRERMLQCPCQLFTVMDVCYGAAFRVDANMPRGVQVQGILGEPKATKITGLQVQGAAVKPYLSFAPSTIAQESVQMPQGGVPYSLFSYHLCKVATAKPKWTYYQVFAEAKKRATRQWPLAHPRIVGPAAMKNEVFAA
jgi:hypothetical protein